MGNLISFNGDKEVFSNGILSNGELSTSLLRCRISTRGLTNFGVGVDKAFGRDVVDCPYKAWEFQVCPSVGISAGDELWIARYILERIIEIAGVVLSFDPKPIQGEWNGAGAHTNYSTKSMRCDRGYDLITVLVERYSIMLKDLGVEHFNADRYYNVTINIGQPPKPYFLDLDTGSDLTWLQCD
ncbi:hypothetical protein COLO4_33549 [Corchorus olitorius]|uniref:Peptidase A1 domain-containing protein n=1 Tax=Corchorus olitorius TaxID=93759 RepID=A0A1R3GSN7_9ROSI|nr:hypothetical protein COLO4_33549 [Corchorus olitorius]